MFQKRRQHPSGPPGTHSTSRSARMRKTQNDTDNENQNTHTRLGPRLPVRVRMRVYGLRFSFEDRTCFLRRMYYLTGVRAIARSKCCRVSVQVLMAYGHVQMVKSICYNRHVFSFFPHVSSDSPEYIKITIISASNMSKKRLKNRDVHEQKTKRNTKATRFSLPYT